MRRCSAVVDDAGADPATLLVDRVAHVFQRAGIRRQIDREGLQGITAALGDRQRARAQIRRAISHPVSRQALRLGERSDFDLVATNHRVTLCRRGHTRATDAAGDPLEGLAGVESLRRRLQAGQRTFQAAVG
ncbi:hypothetical protein D9M73_229030 [compost metagenome]